MTLTPSQQAELDHLARCANTHPNWREYAEWKAQDLALRMPKRWGWLPLALASAVATSREG